MGENLQTQVSQNGNDLKVEAEEDFASTGGSGGNTGGSAANTGGNAGASGATQTGNQGGAQTSNKASDKASTTTQDFRKSGEAAGRAIKDAKKNATEMFDGMAPGHGNEIFFGVVAFITAILIFWIGFFPALFIVLLVIVGVAFGQWVDGKPTILNAIKSLFRSDN